MSKNVKVDPELVSNIREFLLYRWVINFGKSGGSAVPYEQWDDTLQLMFPGSSSTKTLLENTVSDSYNFFISRLDEFGTEKDYVIGLIENEDAGPDDVLAFVNKFTHDSEPLN